MERATNHNRTSKYITGAVVGALALGGCANMDRVHSIDSGDYRSSQVVDIPGCDLPPELPLSEDSLIQQARPEVLPNPITDHDAPAINIKETLHDIRSFNLARSHELTGSGVTFNIYSNAEIDVDIHAIEELFYRSFDLQYDEPRLAAALECYQDRLLDNREFAGSVIHLYIPAQYNACLKDWRLSYARAGVPRSQTCDYSGFGAPSHELVNTFNAIFDRFIEIQSRNYFMIIAPGQIDIETAQSRAAELFVHELHHVFDAMFEVPTVWRLNERKVRFIEDTVKDSYPDQRLPQPFLYRQAIQ